MRILDGITPYALRIPYKDWNPGYRHWLRQNVGEGNFRVLVSSYKDWIEYSFKDKEDALLFSLRFPCV